MHSPPEHDDAVMAGTPGNGTIHHDQGEDPVACKGPVSHGIVPPSLSSRWEAKRKDKPTANDKRTTRKGRHGGNAPQIGALFQYGRDWMGREINPAAAPGGAEMARARELPNSRTMNRSIPERLALRPYGMHARMQVRRKHLLVCTYAYLDLGRGPPNV